MEYQKNDSVYRFITKKWAEVHYQSTKIYSRNKQIRFKTSMLQSYLCENSDAYVVLKELLVLQNQILIHMPRN